MAGTTPIGWADWDPETSKAAIRKAVEVGITFFDTADFYGLGRSEELLGEVLGSHWGGIVLATKVGHELGNDGSIRLNYSRSHILKACEASLRRLRKEAIDLYQLHSAKIEHLEQGECIEAMEELKRHGKIRAWGISLNTFAPEREGEWMIDHGKADAFQLVLNIFNQKIREGFLSRAQEHGYGIIARMPLQFGLLSGTFAPDRRFDPADHRSVRLPPHLIVKANGHLEKLRSIAERHEITMSEVALKFVLGHTGVSTVIPGIKNPGQAEHNARASGEPCLSESEMNLIHALYQSDYRQFLDELRQAG